MHTDGPATTIARGHKRRRVWARATVVAALMALVLPGRAFALNSYTWTGASTQFWSAANWGGPAPTPTNPSPA